MRRESRTANEPRPAVRSGEVISGRYRIEEKIGEGGMAVVYLARHVEIDAPVAIKVMDPVLAAVPGAAERFLLEARAASRVQHPNIVAVSDYGRLDSGIPFIVMEYLSGEDLEALLRRTGAMPWPRVRRIALQVCSALQAAHDAGVIHRDVKPQNCFRQAGSGDLDFIKVLDFGIAKVTEELRADRRSIANTTVGLVVGTPDYMAPEQGRRREIDHRADIYSLGVVLFLLVTGRLPFDATHPVEQMAQHIYEPPPAPSEFRPDLDPRVEALILRALQKEPSDRFATMREMARAIEGVDSETTPLVDTEIDPARRARWGIVAGAGLTAVVGLGWAIIERPVATSSATEILPPSPAEPRAHTEPRTSMPVPSEPSTSTRPRRTLPVSTVPPEAAMAPAPKPALDATPRGWSTAELIPGPVPAEDTEAQDEPPPPPRARSRTDPHIEPATHVERSAVVPAPAKDTPTTRSPTPSTTSDSTAPADGFRAADPIKNPFE